jgi:uncharacterized membrane protein
MNIPTTGQKIHWSLSMRQGPSNSARFNRIQPHTIILSAIILIGFAIRLYKLGAQSLWYDETVSAVLASEPPAELIAHTARDIHPPAYYLFLHYWTSLAGDTEFALAFVSLIFGVLLIPLTYHLGRLLADRTSATWAALLIACSPFNVWYSQEVRMYTLGAALGLAATMWAWQALFGRTAQKSMVNRCWLGYIVCATIGLYTLYYFAFLLIVLNLLFLIRLLLPRIRSSALIALVVANGLVLLAYAPWLPIAWRQATNPPVPPWRTQLGLWPVLVESWSALSLGQSVQSAAVWPILLLALVLLVAGVTYLSQQGRAPTTLSFRAIFLFLYTFGPLGLIVLLSFIVPLYHVRYVFTFAPAFYILLGAGIVWLARHPGRWPALIAASLLLAASAYSIYQLHFDLRNRSDDFRAAVNFIESHWQPGDAILINAGYTYPAFLYYADDPYLERQRLVPYQAPADLNRPRLLQTGSINSGPQLGWHDPRSDFYPTSPAEITTALERLSMDHSRLWLLRAYDTVTDPTGLIRTWLAEHAIPIEDQVFAGESNIRAQGFLFAQPHPGTDRMVHFQDGLALADWNLPDQTWQPGQTIHLKFWWLATAAPGVDYKMSLKLWTPTAELAAQGQDEWPVGNLYRMTGWPIDQPVYQATELKLPLDLPPGQYWLNVELYHAETIQPLPRLDGEAAVTLGSIMVEVPGSDRSQVQ